MLGIGDRVRFGATEYVVYAPYEFKYGSSSKRAWWGRSDKGKEFAFYETDVIMLAPARDKIAEMFV